MRHIRLFLSIFAGFACISVLNSCNTCNRPQTLESIVIDIDLSELADESIYLSMSNQVLYALPTPIEASMLVKNWGVPHTELLNDPAHASAYLTKKKQALNLGVYITDLTTAGIYEQTQTVLRYKQAIMQLIEGLGLQSAADADKIKELEDNLNNKSELLRIVSDIYASCTEFLSEDDRDFYALAMLSGGWVEGMHLATGMIDENDAASLENMKNVVTENKLTFDLLWEALGNLDVIPDEALYLMLDMSYLAHIYGHSTLLSVSAGNEARGSIDNVTPEFFADFKSHIAQLRNQFTKI